MTLTEYLRAKKKGVFSVAARRVGKPYARRIIEVPSYNHQDIWVWRLNSRGDKTSVEARFDRRLGKDAEGLYGTTPDDYEIVRQL